MNTKKWPMFEDWEEIFDKDRATGEFAEAPLDTTKEIQKSLTPQFCNDMSLGFPIDVDDEEEDGAYHSSKVDIGEAENATGHSAFTIAEDATEPSSFSGAENATGPSVFTEGENLTGASAGTSENENVGSQQTHKQGENAKRSSSNVNEKEKNKKRKKKIAEDDNKTFLKGMMEVLKIFTGSQNKRMGALIEKLGERDRSDVCGQIYSILKSPVFLELYTVEQRIKAAMDIVSLSKPGIENLPKLKNRSEPWLVVLYAPWCCFCQAMEGSYVELAEKLGELWHESSEIKGRCVNGCVSDSLKLVYFWRTRTITASKVKSSQNLAIKYPLEKRDVDSMLAFVNALRLDLAEKGRILCSDGRVATAIAASPSDLDEREEVGRQRGALLSLILGIWIETLRLFSGGSENTREPNIGREKEHLFILTEMWIRFHLTNMPRSELIGVQPVSPVGKDLVLNSNSVIDFEHLHLYPCSWLVELNKCSALPAKVGTVGFPNILDYKVFHYYGGLGLIDTLSLPWILGFSIILVTFRVIADRVESFMLLSFIEHILTPIG
ncbi:hypothetical protein BC332_23905 [Capsicum chinense]|nr:hypothetical protein BC332_23905 [Capsicum chinense]